MFFFPIHFPSCILFSLQSCKDLFPSSLSYVLMMVILVLILSMLFFLFLKNNHSPALTSPSCFFFFFLCLPFLPSSRRNRQAKQRKRVLFHRYFYNHIPLLNPHNIFVLTFILKAEFHICALSL